MGLPDFHRVESSYRQLYIDNTTDFHMGPATYQFINYSGYGEILRAKFRIAAFASILDGADIFRVQLDGTDVFNEAVEDVVTVVAHPDYDIANVVKYQKVVEIIYMLRPGIKFNNTLLVDFSTLIAGLKTVEMGIVLGLY